MKIIQEFKDFAVKGNVIDLAVGVIIGSAFGKIVSSLVTDIIMPPLGFITGGIDFSNKVITLKEKTDLIPALTLNYGMFLNNIINFIIISFAIFMIIKQINKVKKDDEKTAEIPKDIQLLTEIRDLLKK